MVNRSVTWAAWDEELLALELQELNAEEFDLSLTGFDPGEIDGLLAIPDEERANAAPPLTAPAGPGSIPHCQDSLRTPPAPRAAGGATGTASPSALGNGG